MALRRNNSIKRQAILDALCASREHPSAEMLYDALKADHPQLSLGTVYRNLSGFVDDGAAVTVASVDGHLRYDGDVSAHAHFICRKCRRVLDLPLPFDAGKTCSKLEKDHGCSVDGFCLTFSGICPECTDQT